MTKLIKQLFLGLLLLILAAGVLPWALTWGGMSLFADSPAGARTLWTAARFTSLYDRDIVIYNIGNSHLKERAFDEAVREYQAADAITTAQNRCPIRYNWGLALSHKGDATSDGNAARTAYSEALRVISINSCLSDPQYAANFKELADELLKKLQALNQGQQQSQKPNQGDPQDAEDLAKDTEKEKQSARDYQNDRRYYEKRQDNGGAYKFEFVW